MSAHRLPQLACAFVLLALLAGCERPQIASVQRGYRGTGKEQLYNPRLQAQQAALNTVPPAQPAAAQDGPRASQIFKNVKVLGDQSVGEFTRTMAAMTQWVAPAQGCVYCHNPQDLADDSLYTKVVARRMLEMTRNVNANWTRHVAATGVTCFTCHRGQPVPAQVWFAPKPPPRNVVGSGMGDDAGQNRGVPSVAYTAMPYDPFTPFLAEKEPIRVQTKTALPTGNHASIKQTEYTYSLMMHMSQALGQNCTFCHNTQSFQSWAGPPQRVTAYHGIRMARELNTDYLQPLTASFPTSRKGPTGDVAKVNCATCHQGQNKPLAGLQMAAKYPALLRTTAAAVAAPPRATLPDPLSEPTKSVLYFAVGSAALEGPQANGLGQLVATLKAKPAARATISGYHSASGDPAQNRELAKQRAFAVRDALVAAGVSDKRVVLDKPQQVQANAGGEDASSRRVEVTLR